MFLLKQILPAAIISMMVAAVVSSIGWFAGTKRMRATLEPLAVGTAYFAGHLFVTGWNTFPPKDTTNWLPCFALVTAGVGAVLEVMAAKLWIRVVGFFLIFAGALRLLLKPKFEYGWSLAEGSVWVVSLAVITVLIAIVLEVLMRRPLPAIEAPAFLIIICAGTFGVLALSGSLLLGQFAVVFAGAVLGCGLPAVRKQNLDRAIGSVVSLLLTTLLLSGYFFAELPASSAALIFIAPLFALVPLRRLKSLAFPARATLVSIPILIALVLALRSSPPLLY